MKILKNKIRKTVLVIGATLLMGNALLAQSGNYFAGPSSGTGNTGFNNVAVGNSVLYAANSGSYNTALGSNTMTVNSSGYGNVAIGGQALYFNGTGFNNSVVGSGAMTYNVSGYEVSAFGNDALHKNLRSGNSAFGSSSMRNNTTGGNNNAFGYQSMFSNDSGQFNNCFGSYTLYSNISGNRNCAFGTYSLDNNTTASGNCGFGYNTLTSNTTGYSNVAMGDYALDHTDVGYFNTAIGATALGLNVSGSNNTAVGTSAGQTKALYNKCSFFGVQADATASGKTNATAIGYGAKVNASNKVQIGNTAVTSIGGQVGFTTFSDLRLKENIKDSKLGLDFILNLHPVTYNYIDENQKGILYTGLIAQEVDAAAKKEGVDFSGVDKNGEFWGIRYGDLTVPLIKAVQQMNETLKSENELMKMEIAELRNEITTGSNFKNAQIISSFENKLEQNNPNPFSDKTTINYSINNNAVSAHIIIRSLNGVEMKSINLENRNAGSITIEGSQLAQGTYTYTLEVNGKSVDTKLMVITK